MELDIVSVNDRQYSIRLGLVGYEAGGEAASG